MSTPIIRPQPGPQTMFVSSLADIAVFGGAAGGGKSYGLLIDPLRNVHNPLFGGVLFRRTFAQVKNEGGLWDQSMRVYSLLKARPIAHTHEWKFPLGMSMSFGNLEYEKDVLNWQGSEVPWMGFDELTHFSEKQFFYMFSRNRSTSGVKPRIRATCNPDPDSFVAQFIAWWIGPDGYPIRERSGKLRFFIRVNDEMIWANSAEEIYQKYGRGPEIQPTSVTFIPSKLEDNKILMEKDPTYAARLLALNRVDRMRLKEGNWKIRASAGTLFRREWFRIVDAVPSGWTQCIRYWDRAATKPHEQNKDPDWTRGLKLYKYGDGRFCVVDLKSEQETPFRIEQLIVNTASHDTQMVKIMSQQDPGSAGVSEADHFIRMLQGYDVHVETINKDKVTRAKPVSAQVEAGNVLVLRAPWNDSFFTELENFPEGAHDDIVDVFSGAFNNLCEGASMFDVA